MKTVGAFEAKTHLSELIRDVERGETIEITKNKRVVARLIPVDQKNARLKAISHIINLRQGITLGQRVTIRELRDEGKK